MRRIATLVTASLTAVALAAPVAAVTASTANAATATTVTTAPTAGTTDAADVLARKPKKKAKLKLKKAKPGTHWGLAGNKITALVKGKGKGKVTFTVNGTKTKKKVKKGKASFRLPSDLTPGTYKVKAKYKKRKGSIKTIVWDSALNVNAAEFTISAAADSWDYPDLTGTVKFKGKTVKTGWVDIYRDGKNKGGSTSKHYCCMTSVGADSTFKFSGSKFLSKVAENGPGTYQYRAFYTPTASYAEYIYSQWITVTVTP